MIKYYNECIEEDKFVKVVLKHSDVMSDAGFNTDDLLYNEESIKEYILNNYKDYLELYLKYKDY